MTLEPSEDVSGLLFIVLALSWAIGAIAAPAHVKTMDFYSTAAQIVPVLLLVLALEARVFEIARARDQRRPPVPSQIVNALIVLVFLLTAEYEALRPLMTGNLSGGHPSVVLGGLAVGFVAIAVIGLTSWRGEDGKPDS